VRKQTAEEMERRLYIYICTYVERTCICICIREEAECGDDGASTVYIHI
jgi:hypothetical protein